jgi:hypothetical protein
VENASAIVNGNARLDYESGNVYSHGNESDHELATANENERRPRVCDHVPQ